MGRGLGGARSGGICTEAMAVGVLRALRAPPRPRSSRGRYALGAIALLPAPPRSSGCGGPTGRRDPLLGVNSEAVPFGCSPPAPGSRWAGRIDPSVLVGLFSFQGLVEGAGNRLPSQPTHPRAMIHRYRIDSTKKANYFISYRNYWIIWPILGPRFGWIRLSSKSIRIRFHRRSKSTRKRLGKVPIKSGGYPSPNRTT